MANPQIVGYIKSQLAAGVVEPEIQKALTAAGWSQADISGAFVEAKAPAAPAAPVPVTPSPVSVPASKPLTPLQPISQQPISTTTMQMNVQGTPSRSWKMPLIIVVVMLLLVGAGAAAYMLVPAVKDVVGYYFGTTAPVVVEEVATTTPPNIQTDAANGYSVTLPDGMTLAPKSFFTETVRAGETATGTLPAGSMEAPWLFIASKILYASTTKADAVYDYDTCCTGARYWFETGSSTTLKAETIGRVNDKATYTALPLATTTPAGSVCTLARTIGAHTFYRIESGDEGVPTHYYYYLPTGQGYVLRFMTYTDLDNGGADIAAALGSLTLMGANETTVQCQ